MTVEQKRISRQIRNEFKRDVLMQLLSEKTTSSKTRRELVFSSRNSVSSHVSRKLLLEEHKLDVRLEQIEKERRQFLNNNNNEKYMLRLSLGVQSARVWRKKQKSEAILRRHSEGNQISQNPTNPSKRTNVLTGQNCVKKRELTKTQVKELQRMKDSLSWERDYVTPQVPPPSRISSSAPSTVNLFLHNTTTHPEIVKPVPVATLLAWNTKKLLNCTSNFDEGESDDSSLLNSQELLSLHENQDNKGFIERGTESHSEENQRKSLSKSLSPLKTNRAIGLLPSVKKLNISKISYQSPQRRAANLRNCKDERKEGETLRTCDEIESNHKCSLSNIDCRDEVGDSRSNNVSARRDELVEQPHEATRSTIASRVEIGSNRQRIPKTAKRNNSRVSLSETNPTTNVETTYINLQLSDQDVNDHKERNSQNFKTKKHNVNKHCNNKTTITTKRENRKSYQETATNDVSGEQSKEKFLRKMTYEDFGQENVTCQNDGFDGVGEDGTITGDGYDGTITGDGYDGTITGDGYDGALTNDDVVTGSVDKYVVAKDGVFTLHGDLRNHTPSEEKSCVVQEETKSQKSFPNHLSPLCLPSPNQVKKFEQNARKKRKEKAFLKMRRYKNSHRQALELQLNG